MAFPLTDDQSVTVTYKEHGNSIVVPVTINGKGPYHLLLDTGASITLLKPSLVKALDLKSTGSAVRISGVGGGSQAAYLYMAQEIAVGKARAFYIPVAARSIKLLNKNNISGLLGQDFLERFELNINTKRKKVTFSLAKDDDVENLSIDQIRDAEVLRNPRKPFQPMRSLNQELTLLYNEFQDNPEPTLDKLMTLEKKLVAFDESLGRFYERQLQRPLRDLAREEQNNLQKFLYCYGNYRKNYQEIQKLARAMKIALAEDYAPEEIFSDWERLEKAVRAMNTCL